MKKILMLVLLSTLIFAKSYTEFAKENGYETDFKVALAKAKEQRKDLMFLLITNYCPWCKKFEQRTLSDALIRTKIQQKFIPLILNREEKKFPARFDSPRIPVVYFVSYKDDKIVTSTVGFQTKEEFLPYLK